MFRPIWHRIVWHCILGAEALINLAQSGVNRVLIVLKQLPSITTPRTSIGILPCAWPRYQLHLGENKFMIQFPDLIEGLDTLAAMRGLRLLNQLVGALPTVGPSLSSRLPRRTSGTAYQYTLDMDAWPVNPDSFLFRSTTIEQSVPVSGRHAPLSNRHAYTRRQP